MCGRFALFASPELTAEYFALAEAPALAPHYNVTPGQDIAAVRVDRDGARRLRSLRWGLVPFWAKDAGLGRRLINARLDSLATKPAFREALTRRRCLIPASGFYEWGVDAAGKKQPFFIRPRGEPLLAIAGLWERWRPQGGEPLETCVIVTTEANRVARADPRSDAGLALAGRARDLARSVERHRGDCRARGSRSRARDVGRRCRGERPAQRRRARDSAGPRASHWVSMNSRPR